MKLPILLLCSLFIFSNLHGQEEDFFSSNEAVKNEKSERKIDRWSFGGNFSLSLGSNSSYIETSPMALYKVTPRFKAGAGFTYIFSKVNEYSNSIYGPRAISTYTLFENLKETININIGDIVLHSEYEFLNIQKFDSNYGYYLEGRTWISNFLVGGGIYQHLGNRGGISLIILYNLIDNKYPLYSNPIFRVGFYF